MKKKSKSTTRPSKSAKDKPLPSKRSPKGSGPVNSRAGAATRSSRTTSRSPQSAESPDARRARGLRILQGLHALYADADCALQHDNAWQLLIATILSAQSTDETVNKVTPILFQRFPTPQSLADAMPDEVEKLVYPTGFFRQKTRSIQGASRILVERFNSQVPQTVEDLTQLPGVARKTANVVLGTAFGKNEGVVVDTHVGRLATRMKLTWRSRDEKDAVKIELDLQELIPRDDWTYFGHAMIWHGRRVCSARKPKCDECTLAPLCPSAGRC